MNNSKVKIIYLLVSGCPGVGKSTFCKKLDQFITDNFDAQLNNKTSIISLLIAYDEIVDKQIEYELINQNESEWKSSRIFLQSLVINLGKFLYQNHLNSSSLSKLSNYFDNSSLNIQENIRVSIQKNFINSLENQIKKLGLLNLKNQNEIYFTIILDDIFYYESMRHLYFKSALSQEFSSFFSLCFKTSNLEFLLERNQTREPNAKLENTIIQNIFSKFEYPNRIDWESKFSKVDLVDENIEFFGLHFENLIKILLENHHNFSEFRCEKVLEEKNKELNLINGQKSCQNLIHECDLILRRLVKTKLSEAYYYDKKELKNMAENIHKNKSKILERIKDLKSELYLKLVNLNDMYLIEIELGELLKNGI
ncbi:unnamed protein product [Brachionus calyciflorus]|uniref:L-seryl-tRNA(Sec) kinase n=1 Tax=Brachionus calyciflorus TaxID=104777 RepID=A0A813P1T0_9BILA|nr:unnamed protein product [Brachionus calyciflorus]